MWPNPQETADLVTFTKETLNEKLHFLWSGMIQGKLQLTIRPCLNIIVFRPDIRQNIFLEKNQDIKYLSDC